MAILVNHLAGHDVAWVGGPFSAALSDHGLLFAYLMWVVILAILYIPCRWYAGLKLRRKDWTWLSYV